MKNCNFRKRILAYGDSNTYGWDPRDFFGEPYAHPWPSLLSDYTGEAVINLGVPGREIPFTEQQFSWMESELVRNSPLDLLIIMLGTNDLLNSPNPDSGVIAKRMDRMLGFLTGECKAQGFSILLVCPPELRTDVPVHLEVSKKMAVEYRTLAERYGIGFADASALNLPLSFDGVHLTEEGHQKLAEFLAETLRNNIQHIGTM